MKNREQENSHFDEYYDLIMKLLNTVLTFKNSDFSEEDESRIIQTNLHTTLDLNFRPRNELLIPYIAIKFPLNIVKSITVGPMKNQQLAYDSLRMFLNKNISDWNAKCERSEKIEQIELYKSGTPYRN